MLLNRKFIFIVEGNVQNRLVFQISLGRQGAWMEFEPSGEKALEHLKRLHKVDLIILDLASRGHDSGYDLFDHIRAHAEYNAVPIVAMTTFDFSRARYRTQEKGFNGLILKPIDINLFPRQIARILEGENIWPADVRSVANT